MWIIKDSKAHISKEEHITTTPHHKSVKSRSHGDVLRRTVYVATPLAASFHNMLIHTVLFSVTALMKKGRSNRPAVLSVLIPFVTSVTRVPSPTYMQCVTPVTYYNWKKKPCEIGVHLFILMLDVIVSSVSPQILEVTSICGVTLKLHAIHWIVCLRLNTGV